MTLLDHLTRGRVMLGVGPLTQRNRMVESFDIIMRLLTESEPIFDGPAEGIIDVATESGRWVVGTPDDLVAAIHRLDEDNGGFGGLLIVATEWGNRGQVMKSYELIARYVVPQFQNSLHNLAASEQWAIDKRDHLKDMRTEALKKAGTDYEARRGGTHAPNKN